MSDTEKKSETETETLARRAVALPPAGLLADTPLGWAKSLLLTRAGVPLRDETHPSQPHPLRAGLTHTHASERGDDVPRVPGNFAWPDPAPQTLGEAMDILGGFQGMSTSSNAEVSDGKVIAVTPRQEPPGFAQAFLDPAEVAAAEHGTL